LDGLESAINIQVISEERCLCRHDRNQINIRMENQMDEKEKILTMLCTAQRFIAACDLQKFGYH
jgi:hypothetical protein